MGQLTPKELADLKADEKMTADTIVLAGGNGLSTLLGIQEVLASVCEDANAKGDSPPITLIIKLSETQANYLGVCISHLIARFIPLVDETYGKAKDEIKRRTRDN